MDAVKTNETTIKPTNIMMQSGEEEDSIDLLEVFFRLLDSWKLLLICTIVVAAGFGVYTKFLSTPVYQATSTIYVLSNKESVINMSDLQIGSALTNDYVKVFQMWEVHEQVIQNLDLPYNYREMQSKLSVANANNTRMLDISFKSTSPKEAAAVANEYAKVTSQYIADTMAVDKPSLMSTALEPTIPVSAGAGRNSVIGALLGFVLAAGFVVVRFLMDDKVRTADDVLKATGLINLAAIPAENNQKTTQKNSKSKSKSRKGGAKK